MLRASQKAFLAAYARLGVVSAAAEASRIGRRNHYEWIADAEYALAFASAEEEAVQHLETEARRRAVEGAREPVIYQGRLCFDVARDASTGAALLNDEGEPMLSEQPLYVSRKSDLLLMFLLKAKRPQTYRDFMKVEHSGELSVITDRLVAARKRVQAE